MRVHINFKDSMPPISHLWADFTDVRDGMFRVSCRATNNALYSYPLANIVSIEETETDYNQIDKEVTIRDHTKEIPV